MSLISTLVAVETVLVGFKGEVIELLVEVVFILGLELLVAGLPLTTVLDANLSEAGPMF